MPTLPDVVAFALRCPGLDGGGCPAEAVTAFGIGSRAQDGLSVARLHDVLSAVGWTIAVGAVQVDGGGTAPCVDPLCPHCGTQLRMRLAGGVA